MKVVSFANVNHGGLVNLQNSIKPGWEHIVIGKDLPWKGWKTRTKAIIDYLTGLDKKSELIVLCDAFDVLCLRDSEQFEQIFSEFKTNVVVSAESICNMSNCFSPTQFWNARNITSKNKYCCAGLVCGYADALLNMYQFVLNYEDDQIGIGHFMNEQVNAISLDTEHQLFFNDNYGSMEYKLLENNSIEYENKIIQPFFIHFPGMNILGSIRIFHPFYTPFESGKNYSRVGTQVNGDMFLEQNLASSNAYQTSAWIERSVFLIASSFLIVLSLYFLFRKKHT